MGSIKKYKKDILLLSFLILAGLMVAIFTYKGEAVGKETVVTIDSREYGTYPLDQDISVEIPGYHGGVNILTIKNKTVSITDADCPDKLCVKTGSIKSINETIICLPHRVVVRIR